MERHETQAIMRVRSNEPSTVVRIKQRAKMKTFEFSIVASGLDPEAEDFEQRFYDAGCDDATIAFQKGHIIVDFSREADSLEDALASAVGDVAQTGARIDRVEPDPLVSLSDMATRAGLSRQAMTNYFKGTRGKDFPPPVAKVTSESPLWDWATVAEWMYRSAKLDLETVLSAEIVKHANAAIGFGKTDIRDELKKHSKEYAKKLEAA